MEIIIKVEPKESAVLVLTVQERRIDEDTVIDLSQPGVVIDLSR